MRFLDLINERVVLFDGAMGSMLMAAGLKGGDCPELWNEDHEDVIRKVHEDYFAAGADVVETNSFGGTSLKLHSFGLQDKAYDLNRKAAQLAREAAPEGRFVAGSVGPTGQFMKPLGDLEESDLYQAFKEQIIALSDGGIDVVCIETMMDPAEAVVAIRAARENTDLPIVVTMTFNKTPNGFFTMMGTTPQDAASQLVEAGAHVVGANCGNGPDEMIEVIPDFAAAIEVPLLFQSNAGMPKLVEGKTVYDMGPDEYAPFVERFVSAGASLIGGCCGTTPEHIRKLKSIL